MADAKKKKVSCDGGDAKLGHPKVYLNTEINGSAECPYCGKKFTSKKEKVT